jgi:hypothetical protein
VTPGIAAADATGGIAGYVLDSATNKPVPGAAVIIVRLPVAGDAHDSVLANRDGSFTRLGLQPGSYAVTASVQGRSATCVIDDLYTGLTRHMKIYVSSTSAEFACVHARPSRSLVNPDETAAIYVVR